MSEGKSVAITLPDAAERVRAGELLGDENPAPGVRLWGLSGGDAVPSPFGFFSSLLKQAADVKAATNDDIGEAVRKEVEKAAAIKEGTDKRLLEVAAAEKRIKELEEAQSQIKTLEQDLEKVRVKVELWSDWQFINQHYAVNSH